MYIIYTHNLQRPQLTCDIPIHGSQPFTICVIGFAHVSIHWNNPVRNEASGELRTK